MAHVQGPNGPLEPLPQPGLVAGASLDASAHDWRLVWSDEFHGKIGRDWVFETGAGGWGNNELEYYRRENATVENDALVITTRREDFGGARYTSARMKTQYHQTWRYGRMEARIALPAKPALKAPRQAPC